jgi:hypothetical protein
MKKLFTALLLFIGAAAQAQYCIPAPGTDGCTDGDLIDNFVLFGENGTSIVNLATGCAPNAYADLTAQTVDLSQNTSYTATVSTQFFPDDHLAIWIDFDNDNLFSSTELVGTFLSVSITGSPVTITIPTTAPIGNHRMRVSLRYDVQPTDIDPCNMGINASDYGEAHDYTVNIVPVSSCAAPTNVNASSVTSNTATTNWNGTAPQYSVEYGPAGFTPGTGTYSTTTSTSANIGGLNANTAYSVYVKSLCSTGDSSAIASVSFTTACGAVNTPYSENFDAVTLPNIPNCMTVEDANFDGNTWYTMDFIAQSLPNALLYESFGTLNADEWLFTPGINVVAGNTYPISFSYLTEGSSPESLELKAGSSANSSSMTGTALFNSTSLTNTNFVTSSVNYTASTTGVVYFGWHLYSNLNSLGLVLDDISITSTTTTSCDTSLTLTATAVSSSTATLNWSSVTGANGYQYVLDQTAGNPSGPGTPTNLLSYGASGLSPNTTYYFHLRTDCGSGFSAWKTVSFTTLPLTTSCDTSATLTASGITANAATLNWSSVSGATGYEYVLDQTAALPTGAGTPTNLLTYPATGLLANTTYYFHLRSNCGTNGFSAWKTVSFSTLPVSVKNVAGKQTAIAVYPNPVKNTAVIELSELTEDARLQVTDISGRVLQQIEVKEKKTEADMSSLAPGIYFIRFTDKTQLQTIKVVKQ